MATSVTELGKYVAADLAVCHGQLTFRDTRVPVDEVLKEVAAGKDWDSITRSTHGRVCHEAIAEAVQLATAALLEANPKNRGAEIRELGEYVIAHPLICHGALTIRGSRVFVLMILQMVADGMPLKEVASQWRRSTVTLDAVAEAVQLARQALLKKEPALTAV